MKYKTIITHITSTNALVLGILEIVAFSNITELKPDLNRLHKMVEKYSAFVPKGIFNYKASTPDYREFNLYDDDELILTLEVKEVQP